MKCIPLQPTLHYYCNMTGWVLDLKWLILLTVSESHVTLYCVLMQLQHKLAVTADLHIVLVWEQLSMF